MNLFKHIVFISLISLFLCACMTKTEKRDTTFNVSPSQVTWKDKFVFDDCIALNGNDSIPLSTISKCLIDDNQFIIYDKKSRKIFAYTRDGQFKHQIGREGRAKSEYINIKDITFSHDHSLLYVLDDLGIIIYDALTGVYKERDKIEPLNPTCYWKFQVIGSGHYLLFNPQEDGLGEIIEYNNGDWTDVRKTGFYQLACERFYMYEDNIRVIPSYGDFNICTYEDEHLTPSFMIEFENDKLPAEQKPKNFNEFLKVSGEGEWFNCILSAHETSSWIYANILGPKQTCYWLFGNKENGTVYCSPMPMDDGMQIVDSYKDSFYAVVHPEMVGEDSYIRNFIEEINESSNNLYLISFHIKNEIPKE